MGLRDLEIVTEFNNIEYNFISKKLNEYINIKIQSDEKISVILNKYLSGIDFELYKKEDSTIMYIIIGLKLYQHKDSHMINKPKLREIKKELDIVIEDFKNYINYKD